MSSFFRPIGDDFWNLRGSFKVAGLVDVGTHTSLVRRANGKFVFIDSYTLDPDALAEARSLTRNGEDLEAIVNVHPFHTVHVEPMHAQFPNAKLYGTARHRARFAELPWEPIGTEDTAFHELYHDDFDFSVPQGVDFISRNENVHFSSVLVLHRQSSTIHVDDTLMYIPFPKLVRKLGLYDTVRFHPTLGQALERRAGATQDFHDWARQLADEWRDAENLCAAHTAAMTASSNRGASIRDRIRTALDGTQRTLDKHARRYG